ncbi:hypothetical protein [Ralstonia pseudosolanacearum]|uniref:hypothetical protein n=1 Tax=Ralstonia pseudosolanacearum TaxID=1310165 RepID=UPI0018D11976|nr:hypothetical protein [Ralstonia pseudosolanacearum]
MQRISIRPHHQVPRYLAARPAVTERAPTRTSRTNAEFDSQTDRKSGRQQTW